MERLEHWEQALNAFVSNHRDRPFAWGQWDCILMACSAVEAITGADPASAYRGRYGDAQGAARALREIGLGTLIRTMNATFPRRAVSKARRGDLVMAAGAAGVCIGAEAVFVGEERLAEAAGISMREGLVTIPRALWSKAWTVG